MGYYTDYAIKIQEEKQYDSDLMDSIKQELISLTGYSGWYCKYDFIKLKHAKWYDRVDDLEKLSRKFPDVKFEVHCQGEDGAELMIYALDRDVEVCPGVVVFQKRTLW